MAKKGKKLNTDLEEESVPMDAAPEPEEIPEGEGASDEGMSYEMGKIEAEDSEDDEAEEFKKAAKSVIAGDDEDEEWVEEVEYNSADEDDFLDEANYDPDDIDGQYGDY